MDVAAVVAEAQAGWQHMPSPADLAVVARLADTAPVLLPAEYLALLRLHDGGEGELGAEPGWFQLWPAAEVLAANRDYQLPEFLPGFFGFGSSGGGELLALDCRGPLPWPRHCQLRPTLAGLCGCSAAYAQMPKRFMALPT
jgi:hypothetical protein